MKKILLLNNGYPSKINPNYVTYIQSIEECLKEAGYTVDLLVMDSSFTSSVGKYVHFLKYYLRVLLFRNYRDYDYVYINNYPHSFLPLIIHFYQLKKVIVHWHGNDIIANSFFSKCLNALSYKFLQKHFIHIAPSVYFAKETSRRLNIDINLIKISASGGVDTSLFNQEKHSLRNPIRLGFASGLLQSKGIDMVLALMKEKGTIEKHFNCKISLHFIDYGKEKERYAELLSQLPDTVKHDPYPLKRMVEFYKQIDILLFPSLRKAESLGLVSLEAMACNIPVVATDDYAFKETVINGVTGERFEINDITSFLNAVTTCIAQTDKYSPRNFILNNYSKQSIVAGYKDFL